MAGRRRLAVVAYLLILAAGWLAGSSLNQLVEFEVRPMNEPALHVAIMTAAVIFILASAVPFVPGAEIGFGLILVFGGRIAFLVYLCMVVALVLAYLIGSFIPLNAIATAFHFLRFRRAREFVLRLGLLEADERLALLSERAPSRFVQMLLHHRYLALIMLFNIPGNSALGGGGGIAFAAGMSGLFSHFRYVAAVTIAVAPVPLVFYLMQ